MTTRLRRPLSPHLQIYRPQLTSVLSFTHRVTGLVLGIYSVALVMWLVAAAAGPAPFTAVQAGFRSLPGQALLFGGTFCFFLHLCGGIRHLFWDAGRGFALGAIYASGWTVVAVSTLLTVAVWIWSFMVCGGTWANPARARRSRTLAASVPPGKVHAWWLERVTAVALVPLMLWLAALLVAQSGRD